MLQGGVEFSEAGYSETVLMANTWYKLTTVASGLEQYKDGCDAIHAVSRYAFYDMVFHDLCYDDDDDDDDDNV